MELRPYGAYIVTVVFLAALGIPCVQLKSFEDRSCETDDDCAPEVTDCLLIFCNCSEEDGFYEKHEQLSWLGLNSTCDLILQQFHSSQVSHVIHIENYTNLLSVDPEFAIATISVWTSASTELLSPLKLVRSYLLNQTASTTLPITNLVLMVDSLSSGVLEGMGNTTQDLHNALDSIDEVMPTDLQDEALRSAPSRVRHLESCYANANRSCSCHLCITKTDFQPDPADNASPSTRKIPVGFYTTTIGVNAESVVVSSALSAFHKIEDNPLDEWQIGTAGGWAPRPDDTDMTMTFQSLTATVCGVVIQGMASSTHRSLDLFSVTAEGSTANYASGALLDTKSYHYFLQPVSASSDVIIRVLKPDVPTRVGFRAGLIACDNIPNEPYDSEVCDFLDEVSETLYTLTESIQSNSPAGGSSTAEEGEEDPTTGVVDFHERVVLKLVASIEDPPEEFKIVHQTEENEITIEGIERQNLQRVGFTYTAAALSGQSQNDSIDRRNTDTDRGTPPQVSVSIPLGAFERLPAARRGEPEPISLVVIVLSHVREDAPDVQVDGSSLESSIGSPIITLNVYSNRSRYNLRYMEYTVVATKKENDTRDTEPVCAFFQESSDNILWETTGCHILSYDNETKLVDCSCNHTTSYAVLFQVKASKIPETDFASIITMVCFGISIAALTMALVVYLLVRDQIMAARYVIHSNLMGALLVSAILFVSGILETKDGTLCTVVKFVYQYVLIAAFCWMLTEGIHLYQRIIAVFDSGKKQNWIYFLVGWGLPLVFVVIAVGCTMTPNPLVKLTKEGICAFTYVDGSVWFVLGPVLLVVVANLLILSCITVVVYRAVGFQAEQGAADKLKQAKAALRSALLLTPLLGSTYVIFPLIHVHPVFRVLFIVVNSLQGLFIAIFYCALNTEIRTAITERIRRSKEASSIEGSTSGTKVKRSFGSDTTTSKGFTSKNKVAPISQVHGDP